MCKREAVLLLAPYPGGAYGVQNDAIMSSRLHHNLILSYLFGTRETTRTLLSLLLFL